MNVKGIVQVAFCVASFWMADPSLASCWTYHWASIITAVPFLFSYDLYIADN